ncbi:MAG: DUF6242 domain-containing protein [Muribaculaceae bacterium]|nr:DUF6242 domain-containing protein [Muribaculaceae bacterium]
MQQHTPRGNNSLLTRIFSPLRKDGIRLLKRALLPCLGLGLCLSACNSDDDEGSSTSTGYVLPSDVAVTGFSLKADSKVIRGLDSVYFSIDLEKALIFNADSLPKGTRVTDLIPVIKYSSYIKAATITMEGGQKRTGDVNYLSNPNDSIDFTGNVRLTLLSSAGNSRTYTLKVNVHETEPDSLCWGPTAVSKLPARTTNPQQQRTVSFKDKVTTLVQEGDGTYTLSTNPDPATSDWTQTPVTLPFNARVRTMTATDDKLWILATDGSLYNSIDGLSWQSAGETWYNIIGAYNNHLLGIKEVGTRQYSIVSDGNVYPSTPVPAGFPIEDFTNIYAFKSQWMAAPIGVFAGGVTANGEVSSAVWAFDGNNWAKLSEGGTPGLRGAVIVPYYTYRRTGGSTSWHYTEFGTILMIGGMKADGELNRTTYLSYDNGVNWSAGSSLMTLPDYIPSMWQIDQTVNTKPMSEPLATTWKEQAPRKLPSYYRVSSSVNDGIISWECPYIYLYGGLNTQGALYNTIWRGVINRLRFQPII